MDFNLTTEQLLMKGSADRFLADVTATSAAADRLPLWPRFSDLGWLALNVPESHGGMGASSIEVAILAEALGRHLIVEPWVAFAVLTARLLADAGTARQRDDYLPRIADGSIRIAFAHAEMGARGKLSHVATTARRTDDGWQIDGEKIAVMGGDMAGHFLVSARTGNDARNPSGIALFLVARGHDGLALDTQRSVDGSGLATVHFRNAVVGTSNLMSEEAFSVITRAVDGALAAWCSEVVGAMEWLLETTVEYTKTRHQFGRPLAANQAVRHRLADMAVALEEARSLALKAALLQDAEDDVRARAVAAAKVKIGRNARFVAEQAVQLHGAMGVTDELKVGSYLKRVMALDLAFGSSEQHLSGYGALSGRVKVGGHA